MPKLELEGEEELFILDQLKPEQMVWIGSTLPLDIRMKLAELLIEYKDIFA